MYGLSSLVVCDKACGYTHGWREVGNLIYILTHSSPWIIILS